MLILTIRTDKPEAEIGLYQDRHQLAYTRWTAHRELGKTIHARLHQLLSDQGFDWADVGGIVVFRGPGSFTGLRIGLTVANSLADGLACPVVGSMGEGWLEAGLTNLLAGASEMPVLPVYGAEANITQPRK